MSTGHIPTVVDVAVYEEGSPRLKEGRITRSMGMKMDFLTSANAAIRDYNEASRIASESDEGYDGFSTMDVGFRILGSRLNDIAIRAAELDDPVLLSTLQSIGMVKDGTVRLIQMGDADEPSSLMPGLCPGKEELDKDERRTIGAAVRMGVHHEDDWTLAMQIDQRTDPNVLGWIAGVIESGGMSSDLYPKALVGRWELHVRSSS